jgi:hypothetical protein
LVVAVVVVFHRL